MDTHPKYVKFHILWNADQKSLETVFNCHLPLGRWQMAKKNPSVSNDFWSTFVGSIIVLTFSIAAYPVC